MVANYGSYRVFTVDQATAATLQGPYNLEFRDDYDRIFLNSGAVDTTTAQAKALRKPLSQFTGKRLHLVQFAGPVQASWFDTLKNCGVEVVTYVPSNAYLVYGDLKSLGRLQAWAASERAVQWDGAYLDDYKIHPTARAAVVSAGQAPSGLYAIQLVADPEANPATLQLIGRLKAGPVRQQFSILSYLDIVVALPSDAIAQLAARPDVVSIQPHGLPRRMGERQSQIVAGNLVGDQPSGPGYLAWLTSKGFTQAQFSNSAFAVDLSDSGVDNGTTAPNHFGLYTLGKTKQPSRVVYSRLVGTPNPGSIVKGCDGHGTINAHIIGGYDDTNGFPHVDSEGYHYGLGIAPYVRLGSSVLFDPTSFTYPNYTEVQSRAYHDGARISNNSWGDPTNGLYSVVSQAYDALVRDAEPSGSTFPAAGNQEMVIVFGAGNVDPFSGDDHIFAPGTAKNVITVGASDNVQPYDPEFDTFDGCLIYDDEAESADSIASFSCLGPCADGRMKPDLVAPGTHISGGVIQTSLPGATGTADPCFTSLTYLQVCGGDLLGNDWPFYPDGQQFYTASSGTSHATPAVSGAAALVRQYFINQGLTPPSPAMTKAYLMNSARYLAGSGAGDTLWSGSQGMGEVNVGTAFDGVPRILRDELTSDKFTDSGQSHSFAGTVGDSSKPFRVTVAWSDAPGSTVGDAFNNDLDLTVTVGGQTYKGNAFSGAYSTTGGMTDPRNNVESVFVPAGVTGPFTVTITAADINSDGVPNNADTLDQDFALVIYNAQGGISPDTAALTAESCSPANGAIDPGETVIVQLGLRNFGSASTTNLVATLLASGGVTSPSGPQNYGALVAGGTNVTRSFTFTASGGCGTNITASLQLQDGASNLGTAVFAFTLGELASTPSTYNYTGPPVAIPDNNSSGVNVSLVVTGFVGDITRLEFSIDGTACTNAAGAASNGINHSYVGDLILTLTSPNATTVTLMSRPGPGVNGSSGANFCHTVLSDSVTNSIQDITAAGAPYTGTFAPAESLAAFDGENPDGTWTLNISDNSADDTGDVRAVTLLIYGHQCCGGVIDTDGDGLPDAWEQQYFGNPTNAVASADSDGDGQSNLQEFLTGTNPTNSASAFRITSVTKEGNDVRIVWKTAGGHTNVVQSAIAAGGIYSNLSANVVIPGGGDTFTNYLHVGAVTNFPTRFYRIRLVP